MFTQAVGKGFTEIRVNDPYYTIICKSIITMVMARKK